jgi:mono/diheme cytochrome c family protein
VRFRTPNAGRAVVLGAALLLPSCQQKMADQPYYRPYEETDFFPDHRSVRPLEPGVITRTQLLDDNPLISGLSAKGKQVHQAPKSNVSPDYPPPTVALGAPDHPDNYVDAFPWKLTADDMKRGQERYQIFCIECHGALGNGRGKIVERGFLNPPSYYPIESLKEDGLSRGFGRWGLKVPLYDVPGGGVHAPVGYIFEVITKGYGGMPSHSQQIPPMDRWRIAAYVRALQLSQYATAAELPADAQKALGGKP